MAIPSDLRATIDVLHLQSAQRAAHLGDYQACRAALADRDWVTRQLQVQALSLLAKCAAQKGEYDDAYDYWRQVQELDPGFEPARAGIRCLNKGRYRPILTYLGTTSTTVVILVLSILLVWQLFSAEIDRRQQQVTANLTQSLADKITSQLQVPLQEISKLEISLLAVVLEQQALAGQLSELQVLTRQGTDYGDQLEELGRSVESLRQVHVDLAQSVGDMSRRTSLVDEDLAALQAADTEAAESLREIETRLTTERAQLEALERTVAALTDIEEGQAPASPWWRFWNRTGRVSNGDL